MGLCKSHQTYLTFLYDTSNLFQLSFSSHFLFQFSDLRFQNTFRHFSFFNTKVFQSSSPFRHVFSMIFQNDFVAKVFRYIVFFFTVILSFFAISSLGPLIPELSFFTGNVSITISNYYFLFTTASTSVLLHVLVDISLSR